MFKPTMKILVVDDMSTMRKIIKKSLNQFGFTNISEADDGVPANKMIQDAAKTPEPFEFIISDWNMPGMTGIDLLKQVRSNEATKKLPFLMVTAESEQSNVVTAIKAGVSNYIVKPFTPDALKAKIEKILNPPAK
jgi:two-component system chemotaxis response regulator CheY